MQPPGAIRQPAVWVRSSSRPSEAPLWLCNTQQNLGSGVTCSARAPQDEQMFLTHFNLIRERSLGKRVVRDAKEHVITTEPMVPEIPFDG